MSDQQGAHDQDPAERLAAALRRIALAVERGDAPAARPAPAAPASPTVVRNLDALIARLRAVLDEMSPDARASGGPNGNGPNGTGPGGSGPGGSG